MSYSGNAGCAQGADFQFSCWTLRALATGNSLKRLSSKGYSKIRNQQVSGSSPLAGFAQITKHLTPASTGQLAGAVFL
jgi:hypothetical protein